MRLVFDSSKRSIFITFISVLILLIAMVIMFIFDSKLSEQALMYSATVKNEQTRLGEFFQIVRVFGKADVLILLAICLGIGGKRRICKQIILSLILVGIFVHPLKNIVGRERPNHSSHSSFPSGDTATAFVLPEILATTPTTLIASSIVAAGAGISRIFYGMHYPSDILAGAALGLLAGCASIWLSSRIKWLPTRNQLIFALFIFTGYLMLAGMFDLHHRHNLQFLVWYAPALIIYMLYPYHSQAYTTKNYAILGGKLYYYLKNTLYGLNFIGLILIIIPWFTQASGLRAPALSGGLLIIVYSHYTRKELKAGRITSVIAYTTTFFVITQLSALGYILGKF